MDMRFYNTKFFSLIRTQFGTFTCNTLKEFIKLSHQSIKLRIRIKFANFCINYNLIPSHLEFWYKYERLRFFHDSSTRNLRSLYLKHVKTVLRLEVDDAFRQLRVIRDKLYRIHGKIMNVLPWFFSNRFFYRQECIIRAKWFRELTKMNKKIEWLMLKKNDKVKKEIKPIKYFYSDNSQNELKISFNNNNNGKTINEINISPDNFRLSSPLNTIHDKWFVNLSKKPIPEDVRMLLQLGEKFGLPSTKKNQEKIIVDFMKCIEKNLFKEVEVIGSAIRNQSIPIIKRMFNKTGNINTNEKLLLRWLHSTKMFVNDNKDILFTKADKGNATVAMDVDDYNSKMLKIFSDTNTYTLIKKDPINKLHNITKNLLSGWLKNDYVDIRTYRKLLITDGVLPRAYGLPKLHKKGFPFRVIVSSINSPLYELAYYLHNIIKSSIPAATSSIDNSFKLVRELNGKKMDFGCTLASLDVVSLFTNVPLEYVYDSILNRWNLIERNTAIPKDEFVKAIKLVLESTFFSFNGAIYKQIFGTPMGSPLSPIIADLVLRDIETKAISKLNFELPLYYRYVDDILLAASKDQLDAILDTFNSFHQRMQFTLEISDNNRINFLDVAIIIEEGKIIFDKFEKPTNTGRYINYHSQHPASQKNSIIYGLIDRTILLSHPKFQEKNIRTVINTLIDNCFPLPLIFNTINRRIRMLTNANYIDKNKKFQSSQEFIKKNFFTIPYVKSISESFLPLTKKFGYDIAYSVPNTLNKFIKRGKDRIEPAMQNDVVYKIDCRDCNCSYVGQTKRKLKTRLKEHRLDINKKSGILSVISNHKLENNHEMNWDEAKILDIEPSYTKRIVSEMIHIKKQSKGLNKQSDTDLLSEIYLPIIENLSLS